MRGRYILILAALLSCVSCLEDDKSYNTPHAAITSFTIGYYNVGFHDMNKWGRDTLVTIRQNGAMYPMTIDQINNRIFNTDSMAYSSDLSRVTTSVYGTGTIGYRYLDDPTMEYLWRSYDSIDFTRGIQFLVRSTDNSYTRVYDVEVNIRKVFPDSLLWGAPDTTSFPVLSGLTSVIRNDTLFCFGTDTTGVPSVSFRSISAGNWNGANAMAGITASGWSNRVTMSNGTFYTVSGGSVYGSDDAVNWSSVKSGIKSLIVAGEDYGTLWAVSEDGNLLKSSDMTEWTTVQAVPDNFPDSAAVMFTYPLPTNPSLTRSVLAGLADDSLNASVWTILSGDTVWTQVDMPYNIDLRLPAAHDLTVFRYDDAMFSLGGGLEGFRQSNDNGITWYMCDSYVEDYSSWNRYMQLPSALKGYASGFTAATDSKGYIWIMTDDGHVWRGAISRLIKK
jgi:hypothetical protein